MIKNGMGLASRVSVPFRGFRGLQVWDEDPKGNRIIDVSVPFRGFRGLQALRTLLPSRPSRGFQSPSGVLGVCRHCCLIGQGRAKVVSVPFRGFRGLQEELSIANSSLSRENVSVPFRGFRGLQVRHHARGAQGRLQVSVPFRGFRGLQEGGESMGRRGATCVSVPFRGFGGLQGGQATLERDRIWNGFSPLPGF